MTAELNAALVQYRDLNEEIRRHHLEGEDKIVVTGVNGHRYIGNSLEGPAHLEIHGVPGNDLAMFMDGASIEVFGNVQDSAANTMNGGLLIVHGSAGDTLGYGLRGGEIFIRDDVGYRCGIHMKEYQQQVPLMVIGGAAGCFLGEYMAGGIILVLNLDDRRGAVGPYCASGMHGGRIYIRGTAKEHLFKGVTLSPIDETELAYIQDCAARYSRYFMKAVPDLNLDDLFRVSPQGSRPYHKMYCGV